MMKRGKMPVILALLLFLSLLNVGGYVKSVKADTKYYVYTENYNIYAWEGDSVDLNVYVEDGNDNRVAAQHSDITLKWYKRTVNGTSGVLGTGSTYHITSLSDSDFYDDKNYTEYLCELYVNNQLMDETSIEIYNTGDCFSGYYEYKYAFEGSDVGLEAKVFNWYDDYFDINDLNVNEVTYKWFKETYYVDNGETVRSSVLCTDYQYTVPSVSASDFGRDDIEVRYVYEVYYKKILVADGNYSIEKKVITPSRNIKVSGKYVVENSILNDNMPEGVTYDKETNTLTLTDYYGSSNDEYFIYADGTLNIELIGENTFIEGTNSVYCGIQVENYLNIFGNGTLNLKSNSWVQGIIARKKIEIKDSKINISGKSSFFYGISLYAWDNYADRTNAEECCIEIDNSLINIINSIEKTTENSLNVGIDAQDADLIINHSNININLTHGTNVFGMVTGLYSSNDYKFYGGRLSIDELSQIDIAANECDNVYTTYFYKNNIKSQYVFAGNDSNKLKSNVDEIFFYDDIWERTECDYSYLEFTSHNWKTEIVRATLSEDGLIQRQCSDCGIISREEKIPKIQSVELENQSYVYTGQEIKPNVIAKDINGKIVSDDEYSVDYKDNIKVGKATVTVKFNGNYYCGSVTKTFNISEKPKSANKKVTDTKKGENINKPKATSIKKLKSAKKSLKITWKKVSGVNGYEIQYSKSSKFKKAKKIVAKKAKYTSKTIKKLKPKKKYYVRIRTYKIVDGKKYYSSWSKKKSKKIK